MSKWQDIGTFFARSAEEFEGDTVLIFSVLRREDGSIAYDEPIVTMATYEYAGPFVAFDPDSDTLLYAEEGDPTHWMPLPAPPGEA